MNQEINQEVNVEENIWISIEKSLNIKIPESLINILNANGFDNQVSLSEMTEQMICNIEDFARDSLSVVISDEEERKRYFGIFFKQPELFKFNPGQKVLLLKIGEYTKDLTKHFENRNKFSSINEEKNKKTMKKSIRQPSQVKRKEMEQEVSNKIEEDTITQDLTCMDREKEKRKLNASCKKWSDENLKHNEKFKNQDLSNIDFNIRVLKTNNPESQAYAYARCIFCKNDVKLTLALKNQTPYWIISNFYKHMKIHLCNPDSKKKHIKMTATLDKFVSRDNRQSGNNEARLQTSCSKSTDNGRETFIDLDTRSASSQIGEKEGDNVLLGTKSTRISNINVTKVPLEIQHEDIHKDKSNSELQEEQNFCQAGNVIEDIQRDIPCSIKLILPQRKWKMEKHSRKERQRRIREKTHKGSLITDYFPIISRINNVLQSTGLEETFLLNLDNFVMSRKYQKLRGEKCIPKILELLMDSYQSSNKASGLQSSCRLKLLATWVFLIGGRLLYETI